jgi:hypothetical protein
LYGIGAGMHFEIFGCIYIGERGGSQNQNRYLRESNEGWTKHHGAIPLRSICADLGWAW